MDIFVRHAGQSTVKIIDVLFFNFFKNVLSPISRFLLCVSRYVYVQIEFLLHVIIKQINWEERGRASNAVMHYLELVHLEQVIGRDCVFGFTFQYLTLFGKTTVT